MTVEPFPHLRPLCLRRVAGTGPTCITSTSFRVRGLLRPAVPAPAAVAAAGLQLLLRGGPGRIRVLPPLGAGGAAGVLVPGQRAAVVLAAGGGCAAAAVCWSDVGF
jgi:hypothetical protein